MTTQDKHKENKKKTKHDNNAKHKTNTRQIITKNTRTAQ